MTTCCAEDLTALLQLGESFGTRNIFRVGAVFQIQACQPCPRTDQAVRTDTGHAERRAAEGWTNASNLAPTMA
eukprot:scaffold48_cov395-Prasinococcus_capsulatus_cf.AAC.26